MKTKKSTDASLARSIGSTLRLVRTYKGESSDAVALILGYKYASSYCKVERGEVHELSIETLLKFCDHFNINLLTFFILAEQTEKIDIAHIVPQGRQLNEFINANERQLIDEILRFRNIVLHQ